MIYMSNTNMVTDSLILSLRLEGFAKSEEIAFFPSKRQSMPMLYSYAIECHEFPPSISSIAFFRGWQHAWSKREIPLYPSDTCVFPKKRAWVRQLWDLSNWRKALAPKKLQLHITVGSSLLCVCLIQTWAAYGSVCDSELQNWSNGFPTASQWKRCISPSFLKPMEALANDKHVKQNKTQTGPLSDSLSFKNYIVQLCFKSPASLPGASFETKGTPLNAASITPHLGLTKFQQKPATILGNRWLNGHIFLVIFLPMSKCWSGPINTCFNQSRVVYNLKILSPPILISGCSYCLAKNQAKSLIDIQTCNIPEIPSSFPGYLEQISATENLGQSIRALGRNSNGGFPGVWDVFFLTPSMAIEENDHLRIRGIFRWIQMSIPLDMIYNLSIQVSNRNGPRMKQWVFTSHMQGLFLQIFSSTKSGTVLKEPMS